MAKAVILVSLGPMVTFGVLDNLWSPDTPSFFFNIVKIDSPSLFSMFQITSQLRQNGSSTRWSIYFLVNNMGKTHIQGALGSQVTFDVQWFNF